MRKLAEAKVEDTQEEVGIEVKGPCSRCAMGQDLGQSSVKCSYFDRIFGSDFFCAAWRERPSCS